MQLEPYLAALFALGLSVGCAQAGPSDLAYDNAEGDPRGQDATGSGAGPGPTGSSGSGDPTGGGAGEPVGTLGVVVIDVQETFVAGASTPDMAGIIARTKDTFLLAQQQNLPFFITFEDSQEGNHALHAPLQPLLPSQAKDFIKTTFAATGQPSFFAAIGSSGLSHVAVLGAETDVCVMQTVLGLRTMGLSVLLQRDAVFTSETNPSPALRRMQQAGVLLVDATELAHYAAEPADLPKASSAAVRIVSPLHMAVVLNHFTDAELAASGDPLTTQKSARLQELLLVSEWFDLPVYVNGSAAGLPSKFAPYFEGQLRPLSQLSQDSFVEQVVVAGTDDNLATGLPGWLDALDVFVMEDALLSTGAAGAQAALLEPFFASGLVPTTYKSFYYEMTQSVDVAEWPSALWIERFDEYYAITQAPEDLPPIWSN